MKIDFRKIAVVINFDGVKAVYDLRHDLGNEMMYNGGILLDIGFEDLAKGIYYSDGEVEIPERYVQPLLQIIINSKLKACIKRTLRDLLTIKK